MRLTRHRLAAASGSPGRFCSASRPAVCVRSRIFPLHLHSKTKGFQLFRSSVLRKLKTTLLFLEEMYESALICWWEAIAMILQGKAETVESSHVAVLRVWLPSSADIGDSPILLLLLWLAPEGSSVVSGWQFMPAAEHRAARTTWSAHTWTGTLWRRVSVGW